MAGGIPRSQTYPTGYFFNLFPNYGQAQSEPARIVLEYVIEYVL